MIIIIIIIIVVIIIIIGTYNLILNHINVREQTKEQIL